MLYKGLQHLFPIEITIKNDSYNTFVFHHLFIVFKWFLNRCSVRVKI